MKIRPTLYVGLGTTGTEILNYLRLLRHHEYGLTEYPIFRYISIETDTGNTAKVPEIDRDRVNFGYDSSSIPREIKHGIPCPESAMNKIIHTTIPSAEPVKEKINRGHSSYNPDLAAWLDPDILDLDAVTLDGGAGHRRMVGRLSLWENWDKQSGVKQDLLAAYGAISQDNNKEKARKSLEGHFGENITVDDKNCNVFIVGTLCGGTCSGMLLDIAYYFRKIGTDNTKIYGIFTIYDQALSLSAPSIQLANCYASLIELDYYKQHNTEYSVTLPNGPTIKEKRSPFNIVTILSATNAKNWRFINENGQFEQEDLDKTVAMDLFVRSLGVDALIDADIVDAPALDDKFEEVRPDNEFVQYMFSSGLEAVWLPKNQTVKTAATIFIDEKLHPKWKEADHELETDHNVIFNNILADIQAGLVKTPKEQLDKMIDYEIAGFNDNTYKTGAIACLKELIPGGECYNRVEDNSENCLKQEVEKLQGKSQVILNGVFESIQTHLHAEEFSDKFSTDKDISARVDNAEQQSQKSEGGILGIGGQKKVDITRFRNRISRSKDELFSHLKNYFLQRVIRDLSNEIQNLIGKGDAAKNSLDAKFANAKNYFPVDDKISEQISASARRLIRDAINKNEKLQDTDKLINTLDNARPHCFHWHIANQLRLYFEESVKNSIPEFSNDVIKRTSPAVELTENYMGLYRLKLEKPGNKRLFQYLLATQEPQNSDDLESATQSILSKPDEFSLPYLRVLYQMEAGFTIGDLIVANRLKEEYDKYQETGNVHIEKNWDKFNPDVVGNRREADNRLREVEDTWIPIKELRDRINGKYPQLFQFISMNGNHLMASIPGEAGNKLTFVDDEDGHKKLAQNEHAFNNFINQTNADFLSLLNEDPPLSQYIDDVTQSIEDPVEREQKEKSYQEFLLGLQESHN